jgi:single-stranded DNA-specific DHH superfamily exonuclease
MILELKQPFYKESLEEAAEKALQQIEEKQYISAFADSDCSGVLAIGIAFKGKTLATAHKMMDKSVV